MLIVFLLNEYEVGGVSRLPSRDISQVQENMSEHSVILEPVLKYNSQTVERDLRDSSRPDCLKKSFAFEYAHIRKDQNFPSTTRYCYLGSSIAIRFCCTSSLLQLFYPVFFFQ